jgi:hypothetical protein
MIYYFRFKVKSRNQALMTPFMPKIIFNQGKGICRLCNKDRQDTTYHMLSACYKLTGYYPQRHDAVVDRLEEAIRMIKKPTGEIFRNKIVRIEGNLTTNGNSIISQIKPDLWFWSEEVDDHFPVPEKMLRLHLIEVKVPWGGIYEDESGGETNTFNEVRNNATRKYERAENALQKYLKYKYHRARLEIVSHIIAISNLGSLDKECRFRLEKFLGKKTKKVIDIWRKMLIVPAMKESYNIWMKKYGYKDLTLSIDRQHDSKIQLTDGKFSKADRWMKDESMKELKRRKKV